MTIIKNSLIISRGGYMNLNSIFTKCILIIIIIILGSCKKDDINNPTVQIPVLTTSVVTNITQSSATSGGKITSDGGATVTSRGICWSTGNAPTIADDKTTAGTDTGSFTCNITGLKSNMTYYVRAYAANNAGTGYGSIIPFTTTGTATDIEGNVYRTVIIGTQVWMAENLKITKYRNGDPIPNVTEVSGWEYLTTGAYCNYNNNSSYVTTYGRYYNWYAVSDSRNIAPIGWHVPTDDEWTTLTNYLGGANAAGGKLKETGTTHWSTPNTGATNETGFTALPGSYCTTNGSFYLIGQIGYFWSSTKYNAGSAWGRLMNYDSPSIHTNYYNNKVGLSIRCIKD